MSLDVDGILHVTAIEKETGKSKHITIARALEARVKQRSQRRERGWRRCSRPIAGRMPTVTNLIAGWRI